MSDAERDRLLLKMVQWIESFEVCAPRGQIYHDLGHLAIKFRAAQTIAEPKPSASTLPQRLRANSYNARTWNDCDVMREAAHALENKDAEIAAVIADNDAKIAEIARLEADLAVADAEREAWKQSSALKLGMIKKLETENAAMRSLLSSRQDCSVFI